MMLYILEHAHKSIQTWPAATPDAISKRATVKQSKLLPTWANYTLLHVKHANLCQNILNLIIQKKKSKKTTFSKKALGNMMLPFLRSDVEKVYRMTP